MNIFYYGHFGHFDGYGQTARDFVDMFIENGHDVTIHNIGYDHDLMLQGDKWMKLSKKKRTRKFDVAIVHKAPWWQNPIYEDLLSEDFDLTIRHIQNRVWYTIFETSMWPKNWYYPLKKFDTIVTGSTWQKNAGERMFSLYNDDREIKVISHIVEKPLAKPNSRKEYVFYGEYSRITDRKNIDCLLKAYYSAFTNSDNVLLKLKIPASAMQDFAKKIEQIMGCFKFRKNLPKIEICSAYLTNKQMDEQYDDCDCFVSTAKGEGFSVPLATAIVKKKAILYPHCLKHSWADDYFQRNGRNDFNAGYDPVLTPEFYSHNMILDTSNMYWLDPKWENLALKMQEFYKDKISIIEDSEHEHACNYLSKRNVYKKFMGILK